jgi:hypothetical protein
VVRTGTLSGVTWKFRRRLYGLWNTLSYQDVVLLSRVHTSFPSMYHRIDAASHSVVYVWKPSPGWPPPGSAIRVSCLTGV